MKKTPIIDISGNRKGKYENEVISEVKKGKQVAYLKRQEDGRYTINVGALHDSGSDSYFATEAINKGQAKRYFSIFKKIWFNKKLSPMEKIDKLSEKDIYTTENFSYY